MLARSLKMNVVAEGVETRDQLAQLALLECDYGQGYYFSKPLDSEGAARLLAARHTYPIPLSTLDGIIQQERVMAA